MAKMPKKKIKKFVAKESDHKALESDLKDQTPDRAGIRYNGQKREKRW